MSSRYTIAAFVFAAAIAGAPRPAETWMVHGSPICVIPLSQYWPQCLPDGAGGAFIVWYDSRLSEANADIYAQRIDAAGTPLWEENGVAVCTASKSQFRPVMIHDDAGGVIIAWYDLRGGSGDIYAQRLDGSGTALWQADGVPLCTNADRQYEAIIAPDGEGGAIVAWLDDRGAEDNDPDIYAQRIDASGATRWTPNGVPVTRGLYTQMQACIVSDGAHGAILAWSDTRNSWANDIYGQHINADGAPLWGSDGMAICIATRNQTMPSIAPDGSGGAIVAWLDERTNFAIPDIFAQHLSGAGAALWTANGHPICQFGGPQEDVFVAPDGSGGALIVWRDNRSFLAGVYAQHMTGGGAALWTIGGAPVCLEPGQKLNPLAVSDGAGGGVFAWIDFRDGVSFEVFAQRLDTDGAAMWAESAVPLSAGAANASNASIASDGAGGAIVAWQDARSDYGDIYAQRVRAGGYLVPTTLARYGASFSGAGIAVSWTLSEAIPGVHFLLERAEGAGGFAPFEQAIEGGGLSFSFIDTAWRAGAAYRYRIGIADGGRKGILFETDPILVPAARAALHQNHPNPFNPATTITFFLPAPCSISLAVYDAAGSRVLELASGWRAAGVHSVSWDGRNARGEAVPSGAYFYRLRAGRETLARSMILLR